MDGWLIKLDANLIRTIVIQGATFLAFFVVVKVFFADTRKIRGAQAAFDSRMLTELKNLLGEENVVLK